jgi:hypothetical protein
MPTAPLPVIHDAPAHEAAAPWLLGELRRLAGASTALDLESADGNRVAIENLSGALRRLLEPALDALAALERLDDDAALAAPATAELDPWTAPPPVARDAARISDVCFAGRMELRRVLRELAAARDDDARLVAAEAGRRKLCRAVRAVLAAAHHGGADDVGEPMRPPAAELASALAIRRLYARFRHDLRRAADDTPQAVLEAVRYAGGALSTLAGKPCYADVRFSDRMVLRRLRERALSWARHDRSVPAGLQLLEDVWTCGNLLRGINRRQELKDHDRALIPRLLRGPDDVAAWFAELDALYGLDDDLDQLFDRARAIAKTGGALDRLVPEVLIHLGQVR